MTAMPMPPWPPQSSGQMAREVGEKTKEPQTNYPQVGSYQRIFKRLV